MTYISDGGSARGVGAALSLPLAGLRVHHGQDDQGLLQDVAHLAGGLRSHGEVRGVKVTG